MLYQNTPFIPFSYYLYEAHLGGEEGLDMGSVLNDKEPINFQVYLHVTFFLYSKIKDTIVLSSSCCCCISFLTVLASTQSSIWEWAPKLGDESWGHLVASTTEASTGAVCHTSPAGLQCRQQHVDSTGAFILPSFSPNGPCCHSPNHGILLGTVTA